MRLLIVFLLSGFASSKAQTITPLTSGQNTSLRGLSVVSDKVIWVSGSNGTVGRSIDGGATWNWTTVKGFEKRDFRDIEAWDKNCAVIIAVAEPPYILKTVDGGQNWKTVFSDTTKGMFLDAIDFNKRKGIVVGDPIEGKVFLAHTKNRGDSWSVFNSDRKDQRRWLLNEGEAFFASSGSNIKLLKKGNYRLVSGGKSSRWFDKDGDHLLPIVQGKESSGANSITVNGDHWVVVGGDYSNATDTTRNCVYTKDAGRNWQYPSSTPKGYKSSVAFISSNQLITCGTSGVDISNDGGDRWTQVTKDAYHVCGKAKKGNSVFLAGSNGKVAKFSY